MDWTVICQKTIREVRLRNLWDKLLDRPGDAAEKGEPKTVRAAQRLFYDLKVIEQLTRDNDLLFQPVRPTQLALDQYGLGDVSKGGFGSGIYMSKEGSDVMEDGLGKVHGRHGV